MFPADQGLPNASTLNIEHAGQTLALVEGGGANYRLTEELDTLGTCDFGGTLYGGYTAQLEWVERWCNELYRVKGAALGLGPQRAAGGQVDAGSAIAAPAEVEDLGARAAFAVQPALDDLQAGQAGAGLPGRAEVALGRRQEGERLAQQALARAVETHNNTGQIYAHMFLAAISVHTGDMRRVLLESQQTWQLADASGDRMYCYFSHGYQALAHSRLGDHAAAGLR